jgi:hypothetical protein
MSYVRPAFDVAGLIALTNYIKKCFNKSALKKHERLDVIVHVVGAEVTKRFQSA